MSPPTRNLVNPSADHKTANLPIIALASLPPELTLDIADLLDPESSLGFALTCRQNTCLLRPIIRENG